MLLPHNSSWIVMVSVDQVIKTSTARSPQISQSQSADSAKVRQSKAMIVRQTKRPGRCVNLAASLRTRAVQRWMIFSSSAPQVWLTAIVRKVYHLQRDGAPQRARAACLIHGACLCIAGYGIMYVTLQQTSMGDQG
jgi:hypothetical protein